MLDGIDGGGKSTVLGAWQRHLLSEEQKIFDLKNYWQTHGRYPTPDEWQENDVLISAEPTYVGVGQAIRQELIKTGTDYPPLAVAQAYSLDRLILYTKVIIPALKARKLVLQDRGVSTSLCYQALNPALSAEALAALPGNALALEWRPDALIILQTDPARALARLHERRDKQDNVIFEKLDFQRQASARFASPEFRAIFENRGATVRYLPTDTEIGIMKEQAIVLLQTIFG